MLRRRNFAGGGSKLASLGSVVGRINGPLLFQAGNASSEGRRDARVAAYFAMAKSATCTPILRLGDIPG